MFKRITKKIVRVFFGKKYADSYTTDSIQQTNQEDEIITSNPRTRIGERYTDSYTTDSAQETIQDEDKVVITSDPGTTKTDSENISQIEHKDFAVMFSGMPADIPLDTQINIAKEIVRKFLDELNQQQSYESGQVITNGQFFLEIEQEKMKIYYELKTLRFITALQIYRDALDWLETQESAGAMNSDVAEITAKHIKALAQDELTAVKSMKRTSQIIEHPQQEIEVKPSKKNYIDDRSQKKNHRLDK